MTPGTLANKPSDLLFIDEARHILNPYARHLEPPKGSQPRGFSRIPIQTKSIDDENRLVPAMMSTPNEDRYAERILPEAFTKWLPVFMDNPVVITNHVYSTPTGDPTSIGGWEDLNISKDGLSGMARIMKDDDLADKWFKRLKAGVVRAFSIGFIAHEWDMQMADAPDGTKYRQRVFTEVELLECSVVNIPANRESLVLQNQMNLLRGSSSPAELAALIKRLDGIEAFVRQFFNSDPGSPMQQFILDVVKAAGSEGHPGNPGCDHIQEEGDPDPDPDSSSKGMSEDELFKMLEAALET